MKRILTLFLVSVLAIGMFCGTAHAEEISLNVSAPSALLMEASTGQVIYEKNAGEKLRPASVTKIMTMLLAFEALESGQIALNDEVITSAYAKSMGGSQVYLEEGEVQTVETLLKCVAISSGNDASVALAEHIGGSEAEFVKKMNARAKNLGMKDTNFEDCCGLTDSAGHVTTAKDVAVMSRELIMNYPRIYDYTTIWMEDITHVTAKGSSPFTLSSTNRLLKQYEYTTGLKTGSTKAAKYCISATARKNGIDLIAVVMAGPDSRSRFADAVTMLNYGFTVSKLYQDENADILPEQTVIHGVADNVALKYAGPFTYLDTGASNLKEITKEMILPESTYAPVGKGEKAGEVLYYLAGQKIGSVDILYGESVKEAAYKDFIIKVFSKFLLSS